ncbi:PAC2 family protein [Microbacterium sp. zg.Y1090]|uniref:proteasome assembly chaperone family protein n=1 Tax=Microbacterium TaxID=33882 RepID=UPI00214C932F|nr:MULTISPECIES: PAC2 family protein [unclassified Microbacterium]MCR2811833.1 PAC2 family protein [Microbacterium sp. zg.Y1084]MCR2818728.1 PAC2 family protein [Microbacterium sp. zg.Y1090]MDL5486541.1 PAC2 family protein [Microbacterium sp. zg-Y1211]WIM27047.1 PAC2 family protein [Microbacterium sp. zg-Y1090]
MPYPGPLYERVASAPPVPAGLPMVIALTGFTDAGGAVAGVIEHMRADLDPAPVISFSNDALLDYRARRPIVSFQGDHLTDYRAPRLELSLAHDAVGQPFVLLAGYEPDFGWEAFTETVLGLAEGLEVSTVTWVHAIPMPVPHTRPLGTTVSGTRSELTEAHSVWKPHTQVPATIGHLLEYRFAESGSQVAGFVLLVPHYLADTEYPAAALTALDSLTVATGLVFDGDELREENREFVEKVTEQVSASEELSRMLHGLEERYDSYMAGSTLAQPIIHTGDLPSADELAAELERFLATRPRSDGDDKSAGGGFGS